MSISCLEDKIIFSPGDIDEDFRPVGTDTGRKTFILGAFNPGAALLPNGNILLMVRVAEALEDPRENEHLLTPRMDLVRQCFVLDAYPAGEVDAGDPRHLEMIQENDTRAMRLTSLSWLLPVEIESDGTLVEVHYDRVLFPQFPYQVLGVEDPRITVIDGQYCMTVVGVGFNRICTCLYDSSNGLDYVPRGIIIEHHNKDVVIFPTVIGERYYALTRPEGSEVHLAFHPETDYLAGKCINAARSPDRLHWQPCEQSVVTMRKGGMLNGKIGPGAPPVGYSWQGKNVFLELFHGVEHLAGDPVGIYRTFAILLDGNEPTRTVKLVEKPFMEHNPDLKEQINGRIFLPAGVVFTTGLVKRDDYYQVFSGELDTAVRMTVVSFESVKTFLETA